MYAQYLSSSYLELGDYGVVTRDGEFVRSGNILKEYPSLKHELGSHKETRESVRSFFASQNKASATVIKADIPELAGCSRKFAWDLKKGRLAALVMIDTTLREIEFEGRLIRFIEPKPELTDKAFVTKVYRCSAYAQLITSHRQSGQVYVGFEDSNSAPISTSGTSISSVTADHAWQTFSPDTWITGIYHPSTPYTPLVTLRQLKAKEPTVGFR